MYLVVECTTRSAPRVSGCCQPGERKVLSTTVSAPAARPSCAQAAMSVMRSSGLLGVSIHSSAAGVDSAARSAGRVAEVDELHLPLAAAPPGIEQAVGAAVAVVRGDDAGARRHQVAGDGDRGHAARGDDRAGALLELRQRLPEQVARRIAGAGVVVLALLAEAAEGERRGQVQRRHDAAAVIVTLDAGAHRARDIRGAAVGRAPGPEDSGAACSWHAPGTSGTAGYLFESGAHIGEAPLKNKTVFTGLLRSVPATGTRGRLVASIPSGFTPKGHADRSSVDALGHVAGVSTFPGWLSLAVAPASKGLTLSRSR